MKKAEDIRKEVSKSYAKAVENFAKKSCCSTSCCVPDPKGVAAKVAGYNSEELNSIPKDAVTNSFGCGNPLAYAGVKEGQTVLDLGSGAGIDILLAGKKVGAKGKAIGIDMTDEMIKRASENIKKSGLKNVEVRKGIIEKLPVEDSSVDWVISNCVINLSPEKEKVFSEIARVLKPGGQVSISDIVVKDLPNRIRESKALYSSCVAGAISEEEYVDGLKDSGLSDVNVTDRLVYDVTQLREFLRSEESPIIEKHLSEDELKEMARSMEGKVWSAKFTARKL